MLVRHRGWRGFRVQALSLFLAVLSVTGAYADGPDVVWTRTYGGKDDDFGYSVQSTSGGGFVIAGETYSAGAGLADIYLIKVDSGGYVQWTKTFGGSGYDDAYSVRETSGGGHIAIGSTTSFGAGQHDIYVVRTDAEGHSLWTKTYGGADKDFGYSIRETSPDSGYIIAGSTYSFGAGSADLYLIKTDKEGDTLWTRTYGGTGSDQGNAAEQTSDGGYIITGMTMSFGVGNADVYVVRTDAGGGVMWARTFGGTRLDQGRSVVKTSDGGYVVAGETYSFGAGGADVYLIKLDADGNTVWEKTFGGTMPDYGRSVVETSGGGYIVAGYSWSFGAGNYDAYVVATDEDGELLWTGTYGGTDRDEVLDIRKGPGGGYIMAGSTRSSGAGGSDVYVIRLASTEDTTAPDLVIGVFQNPYLSQYLDIYLVGSEPLDSASVNLEIDDTALVTRRIDPAARIWMGEFQLEGSGGVIDLVGHAADVAGNDTTVSTTFTFSLLEPRQGGSLSSPDGKATLRVLSGGLRKEACVLLLQGGRNVGLLEACEIKRDYPGSVAVEPDRAERTSYHVGPEGCFSRNGACLEIGYEDSDLETGIDPDCLCIVREGTGPLESYVDPERRVVTTGLSDGGAFRIGHGGRGTSTLTDPYFLKVLDVSPNPFSSSVSLRLEVRDSQPMRIDVYDVKGRHVHCLANRLFYPGTHEVVWDCRSSDGEYLASGTYFIRVHTAHRQLSRKLTLIR